MGFSYIARKLIILFERTKMMWNVGVPFTLSDLYLNKS